MPREETKAHLGQRAWTADLKAAPTVASWLELSEAAYHANVRAFRALAGPGVRLGAVLKGNAYGHGLLETLGLAHPRVEVLYVIRSGEALAIRAWEQSGGHPRRDVLVIGAVSPGECVTLARAGVQAVVADHSLAAAGPLLRAENLTLGVHVHLDTGLGREGFTKAQLLAGEADFLGEAGSPLEVRGHSLNPREIAGQRKHEPRAVLDVASLRLPQRRRRVALSSIFVAEKCLPDSHAGRVGGRRFTASQLLRHVCRGTREPPGLPELS